MVETEEGHRSDSNPGSSYCVLNGVSFDQIVSFLLSFINSTKEMTISYVFLRRDTYLTILNLSFDKAVCHV